MAVGVLAAAWEFAKKDARIELNMDIVGESGREEQGAMSEGGMES